MSDPRKLKAVLRVAALLENINGTGSFQTDIDGRVFIGRGGLFESERPCVNVRDGETTTTADGSRSYPVVHEIAVDAFGERDEDAGALIAGMRLEADVKRALQVRDGALKDADGNALGEIRFQGSQPIILEDTDEIEGYRLLFAVAYTEVWGSPDK